MQHKLKLAVLGGTGKAGKYLVKQLLNQGYPIRLLARNPDAVEIKSPLVEVVQGDARKFESIQALLKGCHAVISTLGQPKGEATIFSQATKNIIKAMNELNMQRYILVTGLNVDAPFDKKGEKTKMATDWMKTNYAETTTDKQLEFEALSKSNVNWTLVRLPLIHQTDERGKVVVSLEDCLGDKISATDLAHFLIDQLSVKTHSRSAPFIATL
ncbi:MAG: NAD(P)H-binding protein [Cyclobacteriaceae bacterium]|nr:NAD(P)H-binding protein [Cyclobacteriaceae bacterium]